jgi:hypothetical protein
MNQLQKSAGKQPQNTTFQRKTTQEIDDQRPNG